MLKNFTWMKHKSRAWIADFSKLWKHYNLQSRRGVSQLNHVRPWSQVEGDMVVCTLIYFSYTHHWWFLLIIILKSSFKHIIAWSARLLLILDFTFPPPLLEIFEFYSANVPLQNVSSGASPNSGWVLTWHNHKKKQFGNLSKVVNAFALWTSNLTAGNLSCGFFCKPSQCYFLWVSLLRHY